MLGGFRVINLFVKTETQRSWLRKLSEVKEKFKARAAEIDELAIFPKENFKDLLEMGYPSITLPKSHGGEGLKVYDMVLLHETLASFDGSTALSIGWNLGVVGELFEKKLWSDDQFN